MKKLLIMLMLIASSAQANSLAAFHGKVVSITETDVAIQVDSVTYFLKKKTLSPEDLKASAKMGTVLTVWAPLDGIDAVKRGEF